MSCSPREIITLQVGHYSNFIGSHWWNLQEASFVYDAVTATGINHDVLFREGKLPNNQQCYTPRLLIIDRKGSLGSLPVAGALYEPVVTSPSTSQALWSGNVDVIQQLPEERNEYLKALDEEDARYLESLDEDKDVCFDDVCEEGAIRNLKSEKEFDLSNKVKVWSDFLRTHLHYKTIYTLNESWHHDEEECLNWGFFGGAAVMKREEAEEEATNRIRLLAESCDSLQGFQLLSDGHNGMGGVSWILTQNIADDFGSKDLFTYISSPPNFKPSTAIETSLYLSSIVMGYTELSKLSSLVIPLSLQENIWDPRRSAQVNWPLLSYEIGSKYESSSILAAFLETISTPLRNKLNPLGMSDYSYLLSAGGRKVVSGGLSFPIGLGEEEYLSDFLVREKGFNYVPVSGSCCSSHLEALAEIVAIRGIPQKQLGSLKKKSTSDINFCNAWQMYYHSLQESDVRSVMRHVDGVIDPLVISTPFPQIFQREEVNNSGFVKSWQSSFLPDRVCKAPAAAVLNQGNEIAKTLHDLNRRMKNIDVSKVPKLVEEDLDKDAWSDVKEDFQQLLNCYSLSDFNEVESMDDD